jgi:hypothetical protein
MDLQNTFYVLAIIFMAVNLLLLIAIAVGAFILVKKVSELKTDIENKIEMLKSRPAEIAANLGAAMADSAVRKISKIVSKRR